MKKTILAIVGILAVSAGMIFAAYRVGEKKEFSYKEHLQDTVFELDGKAYTLEEVNYYIAMEERQIEKTAMVYNDKDTSEYWNLHTNGEFIRLSSKEVVLNTAIHHMLFYEEATKRNIQLTEEEAQIAESSASDLSYDLEEEQKQRAGITDEMIFRMAEKSALAEKYQGILAEENKKNFGSYDYSGKSYQAMLQEHELTINEELWEQVVLGEVTLEHSLED